MNTSILLSKKIFLLLLISIGVFFSAKAQSFEFKNSGTDFILFDLSIPAGQNDIAYAAGSKFTFDTEGVIIKTSDGGETWETIYPVSGTSVSFEKIEFITVDLGFVAGYGLLMKTADGGETWTDVDVDSGVYLYNNLSFFDENNGFVSAQLDDAP
ncbi:MAG: YCF48-related protein, partial [Bacteroidales bacterium]|nr:YCF48-related protein [Bacteroidales bacterium]